MKLRRLIRLINSILSPAGLRISRIRKPGDERLPSYAEGDFVASYEKYFHDSMVPWQGMHDAFLAATHIAKSGTPGDVVECGVFRGGLVGVMKDTILQIEKNTPRNFWLFDTFEGMPKPGPNDFKLGRSRIGAMKRFNKRARGGAATGA